MVKSVTSFYRLYCFYYVIPMYCHFPQILLVTSLLAHYTVCLDYNF